MTGRLLTCGEHAVLAEVADTEQALALQAAVSEAVATGRSGFTEVVDVVPAARTVLVVLGDAADLVALRRALPPLLSAAETALGEEPSRLDVVELPVRYDGQDLDEVAELTGLTAAEVVAAHTGSDWRVAFGGFAPGFAYLSGGDPRLRVPRRPEPRTSVPAGSVALADGFSAVYPRSSPGGWRLLGHTDAVLFDVDRRPPALLQPGTAVRFVDVASQR